MPKKIFKELFRYFRHIYWETKYLIDHPGVMDCFGQINYELQHMSEEERQETKERIRRKIENLD